MSCPAVKDMEGDQGALKLCRCPDQLQQCECGGRHFARPASLTVRRRCCGAGNAPPAYSRIAVFKVDTNFCPRIPLSHA